MAVGVIVAVDPRAQGIEFVARRHVRLAQRLLHQALHDRVQFGAAPFGARHRFLDEFLTLVGGHLRRVGDVPRQLLDAILGQQRQSDSGEQCLFQQVEHTDLLPAAEPAAAILCQSLCR